MQLAIIREWSGTIVRMPLPSKLHAKVNDGVLCPYFIKSCQDWIAENWPGWNILEIISKEKAIPLDRV